MCSVEATLLDVHPLCLGAGNPPQELRLRLPLLVSNGRVRFLDVINASTVRSF